jgi:hypothetical protein
MVKKFFTLKKVRAIVALFKVYQPTLNIVEQIALLTMWIESCVAVEEYEMASALKKLMEEIQKNPNESPQRLDDNKLLSEKIMEIKPPIKKKKTSIYNKIIDTIKKFFSWLTKKKDSYNTNR